MDADFEPVPVTAGANARVLDGVAATNESLLDINATAERLNVSPRFVRRLIAEGRIPYFKIGKYVRIDANELDTWIRDRRVAPTADQAASRANTNQARSDRSIS